MKITPLSLAAEYKVIPVKREPAFLELWSEVKPACSATDIASIGIILWTENV